MKTLFCHPKSSRTGRELAKLLGLRYVSNPNRLKSSPTIRYGNSAKPFDDDTKINSSDIIRLVSDSIFFSNFCEENSIFSPVYTRYDGQTNFPFLLRKRNHISGKDIIVIKSSSDIPSNARSLYHVDVVKTLYEVRVHVIAGKVVKVFVKSNREDIVQDIPIRTQSQGWSYILGNMDKYKKAQQHSLEVCEKVGIMFGAVDIAKTDKGYIVWEINSAPGLNSLTIQDYARLLKEFV